MELCEGLTFFFYTNKDNINELSKKYNNLTFINLDKCSNDLIKYYNYPDDTKFYILGIDSPNKLSNSSINYYQYFIYNENGTEMEIKKACNQSDIIISSPILKKHLINYNIAYELYIQGYDIYNCSSNFYNDDCTPASVHNLDIGFYKRLEDFYPYNISFCLENCTYKYTDYNLSRFICNCEIENKLIDNKKNYLITEENFFKYIDDNINYRIFKCYNLFINYRYYLKVNLGFYCGVFIFLLFVINIIYFCTKGKQKLRLKMIKNINEIRNINVKNITNYPFIKNKKNKEKKFINKNNPPLKNNIKKKRSKVKRLTKKSNTKIMREKSKKEANNEYNDYKRLNKHKHFFMKKNKKSSLFHIYNYKSQDILGNLSNDEEKDKKVKKNIMKIKENLIFLKIF